MKFSFSKRLRHGAPTISFCSQTFDGAAARRALLLAATASIALTAPALAQTQSAQDQIARAGLEEIVVTAEKRESSLQETPVAISVLSAGDLQQRGVFRVNDLAAGVVPSLRIVPFAGRASALTIGMRGIVPFDATQMSRDPSVGIYADGVYLGRVQGLGTELYDVERIEVLKGPQGTLFGRNSVGGAVSIVTRKPTGELGLRQTIGYGNYDAKRAVTHLDLPRFANFSVKIDAVYSDRDGYVENTEPDQWDWGRYERKGVRGSLLWEPTDTVSLLYAAEISKDASTPTYGQLLELFPGAPPLAPLAQVQPGRVKQGLVGVQQQPSVALVQGHLLTASWAALDTLEFKSITAVRRIKSSQYDNSGATFTAFRPNGTLSRYSLAWVEQKQFSQELQAIGTWDRFEYVGGFFYFWERGRDAAYAPNTATWNATGTAITTLRTGNLPRPFPDRASFARARSTAVFAHLAYNPPILDDRLKLTAAARYTHDKKDGALTALSGATRNIPFDYKNDRIDPTITVAYDIAEDINAYVRWGTAYRAGGADSRSTSFRTFGPEEVNAWEIGLKSEFFDNRARLNLAAYHTDYKSLQIGFSSPQNISATETINTDQPAKIRGLEAELTLAPVENLNFSVSYAFTDWSVDPQVNPFNGNREPTAIVFTPKHAVSAAVDYTVPLADFAALTFHLDLTAQTNFISTVNQNPLSGYAVLNGRITLGDIELPGRAGTLDVALWGKNLTNKAYAYYSFDLRGPGLINGRIGSINEPRTYGIEASYKF